MDLTLDLQLRLLVQEVTAMRLGLAPAVALDVTRAAIERLDEDARAGRPLLPLRVAVRDEVWRRRAVCAAEVADTLQVGDGLREFAARLRTSYEWVCGYVFPAEKMPQLVAVFIREGIILTTPAEGGRGRWVISPAARRAAADVAPANGGGTDTVAAAPELAVAAPTARSRAALVAATAKRRALVEADLLAHPEDTIAARARRLGPRLGLRDRAARGRIGSVVGDLRTAA